MTDHPKLAPVVTRALTAIMPHVTASEHQDIVQAIIAQYDTLVGELAEVRQLIQSDNRCISCEWYERLEEDNRDGLCMYLPPAHDSYSQRPTVKETDRCSKYQRRAP